MPQQSSADELSLSDEELLTVLKNHGLDRRLLMKVLGGGVAAAALGGKAAADPGDGQGVRIDDVFGAPYAADDKIPSGKVDHQVGMHIHPLEEAFFFDPIGLHVEPGDVVQFINVPHEVNIPDGPTVEFAGEHTVQAFHDKFDVPNFLDIPHRVPPGVPGFASPVLMGEESWLYQFTETGVYDLYCFPHLPLGMVMRIVAVDPKHTDPATLETYGGIPNIIGGDEDPDETEALEAIFEPLDPVTIVEEGEIESGHHS